MTSRPQVSCHLCAAPILVTIDDVLGQRELLCPEGHVRPLDDVRDAALEIIADQEDAARGRPDDG